MEKVAECKIINVVYECDICKSAYVIHADTNSYQDDNGDWHVINTHICPNCGASFDLEDIKYPYQKVIPVEKYRDARKEEMV